MSSGRINEDDIDRLKHLIRLDEVIAPYTALSNSGPQRFMARCPFHQEKTPSFSLDAAKGVYHCFGCGVGGNAFSFLMNLEGLTYVEAVERLADQFGVTLRYEQVSSRAARAQSLRTRLRAVMGEAAAFYHDQLNGPQGAMARAYLASRAILAPTIDQWQLGWAPDAWDGLSTYLMGKGIPLDDLVAAGLSTRGRHGPLDRFRARIMFPIRDANGKDVVAFGGRILPEAQQVTKMTDGPTPKYINSPKTEIYDKSRVLYGLAQARRAIVRDHTVYVVEGYMDVIGLAQIGIEAVVATCGTALTEEHLALLERMDATITLCLDPDEAGMQAAERARALAQGAGVTDIGIVQLPDGLDPADLAMTRDRAQVQAVLDDRLSAVAFQIRYLLAQMPLDTPEQRRAAYRETFPLLGQLQSWELRYQYVYDYVAPIVGIPGQPIEQELNATYPLIRDGRPKTRASHQPQGETVRPPALDGVQPVDPVRQAELELERMAVQTVLQNPEWISVRPEHFTTEVSKLVISSATQSIDIEALMEALPNDDIRQRVRALHLAQPFVTDEAQARQVQTSLERAAIKREWQQVLDQITTTQGEERRILMAKAMTLNQQWRQMPG